MFGLAPWLDTLVRGVALSAVALLWVMVLVRIVGLRTFSKMTAFDFIVTLSTGSLMASASSSTEWTGFVQTIVAMAALLFLQYAIARRRKDSAIFRAVIENNAVMLMREGAFIEEALKRTRVSRADVMTKLRGANALHLSKVRAVVLETTGDISVLYGDAVDAEVIAGVEGSGRDEATQE